MTARLVTVDNFATPETPDPANLITTAQREHQAVGHALGNALVHAMNAGDALTPLRETVQEGQWQAYLREHVVDISERTARVYMQLAKERAKLERQSSAAPLSIAAALEFLKGASAKKTPAVKPKGSTKPATSFDPIKWWMEATPEARRHFLDAVGKDALSAAFPASWKHEEETLDREIGEVISRLERENIALRSELKEMKSAVTEPVTTPKLRVVS
jgi:hypothetical protein